MIITITPCYLLCNLIPIPNRITLTLTLITLTHTEASLGIKDECKEVDPGSVKT